MGYLSFAGHMDMAIAIRTGVIQNGTLYVQAAAGVVADSVPEMEWQETEHKARAPARAPQNGVGRGGLGMKVLMLDNYDSFTYNIVQYLGELGAQVLVVRNDEMPLEQLASSWSRREGVQQRIVISPGPCSPAEAGHFRAHHSALCRASCRCWACALGHQAIGAAFGGDIIRAGQQMHGKTSVISTDQKGVFAGLPQHFTGEPLPLAGDRSAPRCPIAWP